MQNYIFSGSKKTNSIINYCGTKISNLGVIGKMIRRFYQHLHSYLLTAIFVKETKSAKFFLNYKKSRGNIKHINDEKTDYLNDYKFGSNYFIIL